MQLLNSPLEVAVRVLSLLEAQQTDDVDLTRLVLLDHGMVHSADLGGPASIFPAMPGRSGELALKRTLVEQALGILSRVGLIAVHHGEQGVTFHALEDVSTVLDHVATELVAALRERAAWVTDFFDHADDNFVRSRYANVFAQWDEEFYEAPGGPL